MTVTLDDLKLPTDAIRALTDAGITTVPKLTAKTRAGLAASAWLRRHLPEIDAAMAKHGLAFAPEGGVPNVCKTCPTCDTCGSPRALDARQVVTDALTGRAKHGGWHRGTCDDCDAHHRQLVADRAMELTGRLM